MDKEMTVFGIVVLVGILIVFGSVLAYEVAELSTLQAMVKGGADPLQAACAVGR